MKHFDNFYHFFLSLPLFTRFAFAGSMLILLGILAMYVFIVFQRVSYERNKRKENLILLDLSKLIANLITSSNKAERLYSAETFDLAITKLSGLMKVDPQKRIVLLEHLIELKKLFVGDTAILIREIYISLGLHEFAKESLVKGGTHIKMNALRELHLMDIAVDISFIKPLLNHKNQLLRRIARCYSVKFHLTLPFEFLYAGFEDLHQWEQFELFSILTKRKAPHIPSFCNCLNENLHPSVILFYFKMVVYFRQIEAIPFIKEFLSSKNMAIVKGAIHALGELHDTGIEDFFIANYKHQPECFKIEILKAIGKIKSKKYLGFLAREFEETNLIDIKKQAIKSIMSKNPESVSLLYDLHSVTDGVNYTVIRHVLNPLIKN